MNNDQDCIISRNVVENDFEIKHFRHWDIRIDDQPSSWLFMHGDEEDGFMNDEANFHLVTLSEVVFNRPFIREYLEKPVGSNFGYCPNHDRIEDWSEKFTLTLPRKIYAPNAADIKFKQLVYLKYFPGDIGPFGIALFFAILAIFHTPIWLILSVIFLTRGIVNWASLHDHFQVGQLLPAVVVRSRPVMIAVEYQYETKHGLKRFIRVTKVKTRAIDRKQINIGDRLTTATLFQDKTWYSSIFDLHPLPLYYATDDLDKVNASMNRVHESEWERLNEGIRCLAVPVKPKLYEAAPVIIKETALIDGPNLISSD